MDRKKCLIFSGGRIKKDPRLLKVVQDAEYIICADGGARNAGLFGVTPDEILGDFDTLTAEEIKLYQNMGVKITKYPCRKDYSDTHLAFLTALEKGFVDIDIIAALGGRFDHSLANVMLLTLEQGQNANVRLVDETQEVFLVRDRITVLGQSGEKVSLLPLTAEVTGIETEGLLYRVPQGILRRNLPIGLSNELTQESARIKLNSGLLLVIHTFEENSV